jgi:hypothetical protein
MTILSKNATIYIPNFGDNYTKEISVLVFYPSNDIRGKGGKVYMPPLIQKPVPDWFNKYVIVIPNKDITKWDLIKTEYTTEMGKVGLVQKDLSIGLYFASTGVKSDILNKLPNIKILNLMLMDAVSIGDIINIVKKVKSSGTICYLTYNINNFRGRDVLVKNYSDLVKAVGDNVVNTKSITDDQEEIPTKFLVKWRDDIEKSLTTPTLTNTQPTSNESEKPLTQTITNEPLVNTPETNSNLSQNRFKIDIVGIDTSRVIGVSARKELPEFTIYIGGSIDNTNDIFEDLSDLDPEYGENPYEGPEEETVVLQNGEVLVLFNNSELSRNDSDVVDGDGLGVQVGGSLVVQPGGNVSTNSITIPADLAAVQNSSALKKNLDKDIVSSNGSRVTSVDLYRNMNQFISDVLGPFATFLKKNYPDLYKKWYITSTTRNYVPPGGSTTSQHMRGQAIDSQIIGSNTKNPDGNIKLLNAMLTWYQNNPVGYGQILFETRGNSCWIHWAYSRGNTRLMLARFKEDRTYKASANKTGAYLKPPVSASSLGF